MLHEGWRELQIYGVDWIDLCALSGRHFARQWCLCRHFEEGKVKVKWDMILGKALNELPRRIGIVIPEAKDLPFSTFSTRVLENALYETHRDLENSEATGFRLWNSWAHVYLFKELREAVNIVPTVLREPIQLQRLEMIQKVFQVFQTRKNCTCTSTSMSARNSAYLTFDDDDRIIKIAKYLINAEL